MQWILLSGCHIKFYQYEFVGRESFEDDFVSTLTIMWLCAALATSLVRESADAAKTALQPYKRLFAKIYQVKRGCKIRLNPLLIANSCKLGIGSRSDLHVADKAYNSNGTIL